VRVTTDEITGDEVAAHLEKIWWYYLVAGIAGVLLGFVVLSWRTETLYALTYFAGAVFLVVGFVHVVNIFVVPERRWLSLVSAIVFLAIGVIILVWPHITLFIVALLIALGFVMWGILELIVALSNTEAQYWWVHLIAGVVSLIIAIWAIRHPGTALNVLVILLGIWIMLWGAVEIIAAFVARNARHHWNQMRASV